MSGEDEWGSYDSGPAIYAERRLDEMQDERDAALATIERVRALLAASPAGSAEFFDELWREAIKEALGDE